MFLYKILGYFDLESRVSNKGRDGSWDVSGGAEGHDGDHGKTSVVELSALLLHQLSSVNTREVNWGEDNSWEFSSLGVVGSLGLSDDFGKEDGEVDLGLSGIRDGSPGIEGLQGGERFEGNIRGEHSWEVDSSTLDKVSGGGKHSNTGVLELGGTEPSKGGLRSEGGKVEGIEAFEGSSGSWHISKGHVEGTGGLYVCVCHKFNDRILIQYHKHERHFKIS